MVALLGVAMLLFVVSCSSVGVRLLWLAKVGGGRPALLCGNGFCLIAILGFPLGVLSGHGLGTVGEVQLPLMAISLLANALGIASFFVFTVHVFRPRALWAHTLAGAAIAGTAMAGVAIVSALALAPSDAPSFRVTWGWSLTFQALCALCFFWMGVEGLAEWRMARRRVALGLSDPAVSMRLLMWGVFGVSTTLLCSVLLAVQLAGHASPTSLPAQLGQAVFGLVSSAAATSAFFPPRGHGARLRQPIAP